MIEILAVTFILLKYKKYKLKPLFKSWYIYPIIVALLIYIISIILSVFIPEQIHNTQCVTQVTTVICFLILLWKNDMRLDHAFIGFIASIVGSLLNSIVTYFNNGKMPVFPNLTYATGFFNENMLLNDNIHSLGNASTKLIPLCDILDIGFNILSVGDILIMIFPILILYNLVKILNKKIRIKLLFD